MIQVYQYLHAAKKVFSSLYNVHYKTFSYWKHLLNSLQVFVEFHVDGKLDHLIRAMADGLDLTTARSTELDLHNGNQTILRLLHQVIECCLFINKYSRKSFEGDINFFSAETLINVSIKNESSAQVTVGNYLNSFHSWWSSRKHSIWERAFCLLLFRRE